MIQVELNQFNRKIVLKRRKFLKFLQVLATIDH